MSSEYHKLPVFSKLGLLLARRRREMNRPWRKELFHWTNFEEEIRLGFLLTFLPPMDFTEDGCPELSEEFWPIFPEP